MDITVNCRGEDVLLITERDASLLVTEHIRSGSGSVPVSCTHFAMQSPDGVIDALGQLATNSSQNDDPASIHLRAGALFSRLKALNRDANAAARTHKQITTDARHDMDQTHLRLQNLLYEKRHLEREIEKCRQFACVLNYLVLFRFPLTQPIQLCVSGHSDVFNRTIHRALPAGSTFGRRVVERTSAHA